MTTPVYDSIGKDYTRNRRADPRITQAVIDLLALPEGSIILDLGAGSGNYSNALAQAGYNIVAVEPSAEMRGQAEPNRSVRWLAGTAEQLPLSSKSVDGIAVILAIHHFLDIKLAAREIKRVCPQGPIVIFTLDPRLSEPFWFADYFPELIAKDHLDFPAADDMAQALSDYTGMGHSIHPFPLPHDLLDRNMLSGWNKPEDYLDENIRQNTSGFAMANHEVVKRGLEKLKKDLTSGKWDEEYGHLRTGGSFHAGFYFLKLTQ